MDFPIYVDSASKVPLHKQIYEELRRAILARRLPSGKRVPSTREMAKTLGVARATVTLAYDYLLSEGYFESYRGSGTYVSRQLPEELVEVAEDVVEEAALELERVSSAPRSGVPGFAAAAYRAAAYQPEGAGMEDASGQAGVASEVGAGSELNAAPAAAPSRRQRTLSTYGRSLAARDWLGYPDEEPEISFTFGRPDLREFPMRVWSQLMSRYCRQRNLSLLDCPTKASGYQPLKTAIANYIARARAVVCDPEQVIIVNGSQQALDLVTRVLVDPGDLVGMEEPGYIGAQKAFQAQGARLVPVYVDTNGVRVDYLKSRFDVNTKERLKLLYVTPSHQYPTGAVLSLPRRLELLSWADRNGSFIIEDDYDAEYRYAGRPMPALAGIDDGGTVIYIGTFSKVLLPALRLGYMVVPRELIDVFARAKWLVDRHSSLLQQQVLADFIMQGHLARHIRRMRAIYHQRRKLVIDMLEGLFEKDVTIYGENAGINILFRVSTEYSDAEIVARARRLGVGIVSTRQLYLGDAPAAEFLLNYGGLQEQEIVEGLSRLRAAFDRNNLLLQEG